MTEKPPILVIRRGDMLTPAGPADGERIREFPSGKPLRVEVRQPRRSSQQNRLYWSLLGIVCDNLDQPIKPEDLHQWLKMRLHLTTEIRLRSGEIVEVPRSVAFDKMEHAEFTAYFDQVKTLVTTVLIPGINSEALEREAKAMLGEMA